MLRYLMYLLFGHKFTVEVDTVIDQSTQPVPIIIPLKFCRRCETKNNKYKEILE